MGFIQIIEYRSSADYDELKKLEARWLEATQGQRTTVREVTCVDRDQPGRYFNIVEFESYEAAMANSQLPGTQEIAAEMAKLCEGEPVFYNLDVIETRTD